MAGGQTITPYDSVDTSNQISLKQFPPKLRKVAKFVLESDTPITISNACKELKVNYDSVKTLIWKSKQKGNDFSAFINQQSQMLLHNNKVGVYAALINGAVSDTSTSHNDRKSYFQLTGDLKETVNIGSVTLAIGINTSSITPQDQGRNKGVIDIEPMIPTKGK